MNEQTGLFEAPPTRCFPPPRPFQDVAHRELRAGFMQGHTRQVLMAPTGAGKSYIGLRLCGEALARGRRVVFICDRKTLINQASAVATSYGMPLHGIFQADHPGFAPHRPFQIASAQTIAARGLNDTFDVVVVDECHTLYKPVTELVMSTKAAVIGLSATPFTKGLGNIYSRVINAATMDELTRQKILSPLRVLSCKRIDMAGAKTNSKGEWSDKAAEERGLAIVGDVVLEWMQHAEDRKTIVFGPTVVHCEELVRRFQAAGVNARTFCGTTPDDERAELLAEYKKPDSKIRVLVSVEALAKGFDVPDVGCVVDCRPLRKSLSTFVQMVGRGLRGSPGKEECVLLDHSGNVVRFRDDFSDIYFNGLADLDAGERLDKTVRDEDGAKDSKACPSCGFTPMGRRCIKCGFEPLRVSPVEHQHGKAEEVDILFKVAKYAPNHRELYNAIATYKRSKAKPGGNPKGATAHAYREIVGNWPPSQFVFEMAPTVPVSEALVGKLKSLTIAFAKSKRRS